MVVFLFIAMFANSAIAAGSASAGNRGWATWCGLFAIYCMLKLHAMGALA